MNERAYARIRNGEVYAARMADHELRSREHEYADRKYQRRTELVNIIKLMSQCVDCGYDKHPVALEFDHIPGTIKLNNVASLVRGGLKKLFEEIDKCEVVCANCHRIRTTERDEWGRGRARNAVRR